MDIDWDGMIEHWISRVKTELVPPLLADSRFREGDKLTRRFEREIETWKTTNTIRPVIQIANELAAAECLLKTLEDDESLTYEPAMAGTKKRIDFLKLSALGTFEWIEVKTVAPEWVDDEAGWQRYLTIAKGFPTNAKLVVQREWAGAALAGQSIKARWSFIQRAAEVEARAAEIPVSQKGPVWLLFCSTDLEWHADELEDFADFYRTGNPRADDPMSNAMERYMSDEGIGFDRSLAGFHYLSRKHDSVSADSFRMGLTGPVFGR